MLFLLILSTTDAQIPHGCHELDQLESRECCPTPAIPGANVCGQNLGRGECTLIGSPPLSSSTDNVDLRKQWPLLLFDKFCKCSGNFGGYDCDECKFGYTGTRCSILENRVRKSLNDFSTANWNSYVSTLKLVKTSQN